MQHFFEAFASRKGLCVILEKTLNAAFYFLCTGEFNLGHNVTMRDRVESYAEYVKTFAEMQIQKFSARPEKANVYLLEILPQLYDASRRNYSRAIAFLTLIVEI